MAEYRYFQYTDVTPRETVPHHWQPFPRQQVICYKKNRTEIFRITASSILEADKLFTAATGVNPSKVVEVACEVHS